MKHLSYKSYTKPEHKEWIVFMHAITADSEMFNKQVAIFRKHYNLLLPDLRDHGNSMQFKPSSRRARLTSETIVQDVFDLMDHLNIQSAHFLGISIMSTFIRTMESIQPDRVNSIILSGGVMKFSRGLTIFYKISGVLRFLLPVKVMQRLTPFIIMPSREQRAIRRLFLRQLSHNTKDTIIAWFKLIGRLRKLNDRFFNIPIACPLLLMVGSNDLAFIKNNKRYHSKFPKTELKIINDSGHFCNLEQPMAFNETVLQFLNDSSAIRCKVAVT